MLFNIIEKSKVSSTNLRDKLQFVNLVKSLVFDLTKIPFLERLISTCRLIGKNSYLSRESNSSAKGC